MRHLAIATVTVLLASLPARAEVTRSQLEHALSGYETPITAETMQALGPGWEAALVALVRDPGAAPLYRLRAIAGLAFARTPEAAAVLRELLAQKGAETQGFAALEVEEAIRALASVEGRRAAPILAPFLEHALPDIRAMASQQLARLGESAPVKARLARERNPVVRASALRALERSAAVGR